MKKKILVIAFIAVCLSIVAYSTTAFFSVDDTATNVITMGNIKIELEELAIPDDGGDPVPFSDVIDVLPGTNVSKIVQVKNTGNNSAWIRISIDKAIELAEGINGEVDVALVSLNVNTENWTELDGYYYYNTALNAGETTEPLFTTVSFASNMGNIYQQSKAIIKVFAQATQTANNGETVFEAAGWPAEQAE
ncbi:MAG: hypothetical protein IKU30_03455 [Clostridia bacterium]|nr:hypothetical protein [Clostridia bacterium]